MSVTVAGISIDTKLDAPSKAKSPTLVTPSGIMYDFPVFAAGYWMRVEADLVKSTPSWEEYFLLVESTTIDFKLSISRKTLAPMVVTLGGILNDTRLFALKNA